MPVVALDRLALTKQVTDKDEYLALLSLMHHGHGLAKEWKCWRTKYCTSSSFKLDKGVSVYLQAGSAHGRLYSKLEFQPCVMQESHVELLHDIASLGFNGGLLGLATEGKISYLEISADFKHRSISEFLPFDSRLRDSFRIPDPPSSVETYYLGARRSARHVAIYDKARERLMKAGVKLDHELLRVEMRQRNLGMPLAKAQCQKNPFLGLGVSRVSDLRAMTKEEKWHQFLDACEQQGPQMALLWAGKDRPLYLSRLRSTSCAWWRPNLVWALARKRIISLDERMKSCLAWLQ